MKEMSVKPHVQHKGHVALINLLLVLQVKKTAQILNFLLQHVNRYALKMTHARDMTIEQVEMEHAYFGT